MAPFELGHAINCFSVFYVFAVANFYPPWTLSSSHSDRMKHRILLRYKAVRPRCLPALQLVSTVLNGSQSYDQFMSSTGLLFVTCVLLSYRGFHSCSSVAGSEQIYLRECTLYLRKIYSVTRQKSSTKTNKSENILCLFGQWKSKCLFKCVSDSK